MDFESQNVQVTLANGSTIYVDAKLLSAEQDVVLEKLSFRGVGEAIEGISETLVKALKKAAPSKASVELGLEIGLDEGTLTALLVKVDSKANLKIKLEWESLSGVVEAEDSE